MNGSATELSPDTPLILTMVMAPDTPDREWLPTGEDPLEGGGVLSPDAPLILSLVPDTDMAPDAAFRRLTPF
jgi:hypothetical protein